jgi:hypothetical protein
VVSPAPRTAGRQVVSRTGGKKDHRLPSRPPGTDGEQAPGTRTDREPARQRPRRFSPRGSCNRYAQASNKRRHLTMGFCSGRGGGGGPGDAALAGGRFRILMAPASHRPGLACSGDRVGLPAPLAGGRSLLFLASPHASHWSWSLDLQ